MSRLYLFIPMALLAAVPSEAAVRQREPETPSLERQMLSHVERVLVVDTLEVDKYEFFHRYRTAPSAGSILSGDEVRRTLGAAPMPEEARGEPFTGFTNEFADYMIWAQEDTTGYLRLAESVRLVDGSWSAPRFTPPVLNFGEEEDEDSPVEANAAFPFMLDDGQTLYFASDNRHSLGGYDIFIATKDPSDDDFLIPGNLGMPFNSPYDDYMMVIDRQTGVGWWASDRNQLEDKLTVYIYALVDERVNVDPDDEDLRRYASLSGWEELLDEDQMAERDRIRKEIAAVSTAQSCKPEFSLPMPGGKTYHFFSNFRNSSAASQYQLYLAQLEKFDRRKADLSALRAKYAAGDRGAASRIQALEEQLRTEEAGLREQLNKVYRLESGQ